MQFNNLTCNSVFDSNRPNAYYWTQSFPSQITVPRTMSLISCSIPIVYNSFRPNQTVVYMVYGNQLRSINIPNGYYDDVNEFIPVLQTATNTALGVSNVVWSYSTEYQCLKITTNSNFSIKGKQYNPQFNVGSRLGFISPLDYNSFIEGSASVIYAEGILKLARTSGFYITSSVVELDNCVSYINSPGIIAYVPIQYNDLEFGSSITYTASAMSLNAVQMRRSDLLNSTSTIVFQVLDDELQPINDQERGGSTILMLQLDYD